MALLPTVGAGVASALPNGGALASAALIASAGVGDGVGLLAVGDVDDELLDVYMGILDAHHSLDGHCDVAQQRQLAARLDTTAAGGKRRLVQQPQDSD